MRALLLRSMPCPILFFMNKICLNQVEYQEYDKQMYWQQSPPIAVIILHIDGQDMTIVNGCKTTVSSLLHTFVLTPLYLRKLFYDKFKCFHSSAQNWLD